MKQKGRNPKRKKKVQEKAKRRNTNFRKDIALSWYWGLLE